MANVLDRQADHMRGNTQNRVLAKLEPLDRERPAADAFVGRDRELTTLIKLVDSDVRSARSAFVEGEAGIGKTRLVAELLDYCRQGGVRVLQGHCYQVREAGPYFPFIQILSQLCLAGSPSAELLRSLADASLGPGRWNDLSKDVRGRRAQFLRALSEAIVHEAGSVETVLCIEDIQWADLGSLLVLNNLLDMRAVGLFIVCTARTDEPTEADVRQLIARIEQKSRRIVLQGLSGGEVRVLVDTLAGAGRITEEEVQALQLFANGNPMLVRELFLHLQETGLLERHTLPEALRRTRSPDRLTHVVDLRLRDLQETVFRALSAASVIGTEFSADLAAQVMGEPEAVAEAQLQVGVARHILKPTDALEAKRYRFAHPLFAMRLYDLLPAPNRRDAHRKIAEAATCGRASLALDDLARHLSLGFGAAGGQRAIAICRAAAEQAEGVMGYESAARFWELALRCTKQRSRRKRAELHRRLGWALWAAGKWTQAAEVWDEAVSGFEALRDWRRVGELALVLGDMHRWRAELTASERWLKRALLLPLERPADRARALALLGSIYCLRNDIRQGLRLLEEASQLVASTGGDPLIDFLLSYGLMTSGERSRAYALAKEGLKEAERRGAASAVSLLAGSLVHHELFRLHLDSARRYARILDASVDPTDTTALTRSLMCNALISGYEGRWNRVLRLSERWMAQVRLAGRYHVAHARAFWSVSKLALGDASAARREMLRALPDLDEGRPMGALQLARASLRLGEHEEAAALVRRYSRPLLRSQRSMAKAGIALMGEVVSSLDAPKMWLRCYELLKLETYPIVIAYSPISVQRVLGCLASRLKLLPEAMEHFDSAVRVLSEGRARWELAQTYFDYAQMRRQRRRRGDLRKAEAMELEGRAILDQLGIPYSAPLADLRDYAGANRFGLTGRELEVLALVAEGLRNQEIAETLTVGDRTVGRHLENIFDKMDVRSRTEAVVQAVQEGLVGPVANGDHVSTRGV